MIEDKFVTWNEYQAWVITKIRPQKSAAAQVCVAALELAGEAGECADIIKKALFHDKPASLEKLSDELGDVLFYVAELARLHGVTLQHVMEWNMYKLNERYPKGFEVNRAHAQGEPS